MNTNRWCRLCAVVFMALAFIPLVTHAAEEHTDIVLVIHGGTGVPTPEELTPDLERAMRDDLARALRAGYDALAKDGATGLDGVEAAIRVLEDSPHFNAGKGAVFTREGKVELDAAIMEGKTRRAGGVANVTTLKNPISAARAVMEHTRHVLLVGDGAEAFAREAGLETATTEYFRTERRWKQLQDDLERERREKSGEKRPGGKGASHLPDTGASLGTVGAVALDRAGNLAAGTSTGGTSNKLKGRVGGVPIAGSATYADNDACAVSGTGHGEFFLRFSVAHEIASRVRYLGESVGQAVDQVVQEDLKSRGGEAGVIVLDRKGRAALSFNSPGLARGTITRDGRIDVRLYEK